MKDQPDYSLPDGVIDKYKRGASISCISKELGLSWSQLKLRLKKAGVSLRDRKTAPKAAREAGLVRKIFRSEVSGSLTPQVILEYRAGESIKRLSERLGITRDTITRFLIRHGQELRSKKDANAIHLAKRTPEQRKAWSKAAHAAIRGVKWDKGRLHKAAKSREKLAVMTTKEQAFFDTCNQYGIKLIPQFAVGRYNIDLACPVAKVALEIDTGWTNWSKGKKHSQMILKDDALSRQQWLVIHLDGWPKGRCLEMLKDALVIIASRRRRAAGRDI